MKRIYLILAAATILSAGAAFAAETPFSGGLQRLTNSAPPQGTGCLSTATFPSLRVQMDSNLNTGGANINVRPFFGCTLRQRNHQTQLQTWCFGADPNFPQATIRNGSAISDADILHLCPTGGTFSFFVGRNN